MNKKTAREIYFDNFGNFSTMKRNGEYREYIRRKISDKLPVFLSSYFRVLSSYQNFLSSYRNLPSFYLRNAQK